MTEQIRMPCGGLTCVKDTFCMELESQKLGVLCFSVSFLLTQVVVFISDADIVLWAS